MKTLLASLMCGLLTTLQCFAIDGGPWGNVSIVQVTGVYAGVFLPAGIVLDPNPPPVIQYDDPDSIALFTLRVPQQGLATGTALIVRQGFVYTGTVTASADPDSATLQGIFNAEFTQDRESGTVTVTEHYEANGSFKNTKIVASTAVTRVTTARIRGTANITFRPGVNGDPNTGDSGGAVPYKVRGFKQAELAG